MLFRYVMQRAVDASFQECKEGFTGVHAGIAARIFVDVVLSGGASAWRDLGAP